jgi:hypothetical protein
MTKVTVGACPTCGRALAVKPRGVRRRLDLTCKCGASVTLEVAPEILDEAAKLTGGAPPPDGAIARKHAASRRRLIGGALVFVGVLALGVGAWLLARARATYRWPTTTGVVEKASAGSERHETSSGNPVAPNQSASTSYFQRVAARYEVDGHRYRLDTTLRTADALEARDWERTLVAGASVTVYYDPRAPDTALLRPVEYWQGTLIALFGIIGVVAGVCIRRSA